MPRFDPDRIFDEETFMQTQETLASIRELQSKIGTALDDMQIGATSSDLELSFPMTGRTPADNFDIRSPNERTVEVWYQDGIHHPDKCISFQPTEDYPVFYRAHFIGVGKNRVTVHEFVQVWTDSSKHSLIIV